MQNRGITKSGKVGVHWITRCKVWEARIGVNGNNIILGRYKDKLEAIRIREQAELKYHNHRRRA